MDGKAKGKGKAKSERVTVISFDVYKCDHCSELLGKHVYEECMRGVS